MKKSYTFELIYPKNRPPKSLRTVLEELLIPRKWIHYLRIKQEVLIDGSYQTFNRLIYPGNQITLVFSEFDETTQNYLLSGVSPDIVYEDKNIIIINKPAGQKTHPNRADENNTAMNDVAFYLSKTNEKPFIVHRLDMLTSGLLLIAKNPAVVPLLNRQLTKKEMSRHYYAKVDKLAEFPKQGEIKQPIGFDEFDQRKRKIDPHGLPALTKYHVIRENLTTALLELELKTGRTHQIRVHLASIGAPIVGDPLYNPNFQTKQNLQLVAYKIEFILPFSYQKVTINLPNSKLKNLIH